jgi:hypothetical protein
MSQASLALAAVALHVATAGAQTATLANPVPEAPTRYGRTAPSAEYLNRAKAPPTIAGGVPGTWMWGDELTITGANFTSPTVELIGDFYGSPVRYPLQPGEVTASRFKLLLTRANLRDSLPPMRLLVITPYGSDTSDAVMTFSREPRLDTVVVRRDRWGSGWRRVVVLMGRNLDNPVQASVVYTLVPLNAMFLRDPNATTLEIYVPSQCSGRGLVTVDFQRLFVAPRQVRSKQTVTCLPNDEISSP